MFGVGLGHRGDKGLSYGRDRCTCVLFLGLRNRSEPQPEPLGEEWGWEGCRRGSGGERETRKTTDLVTDRWVRRPWWCRGEIKGL